MRKCITCLVQPIGTFEGTFLEGRIYPHISVLTLSLESSDHRCHQHLCGYDRVQDLPEVETQWVKPQSQPFQLSFNARLKVAFQGSRVTSDGGLILVRELDERLGFGELIQQHLTDSRRGKNTQFPFADLLRQSVYSRLAGYEDLNDAERLSQDPAFRLIGSERIWDRGAALTSRLQSFETEMLAEEQNFTGLARLNRALIGRAEKVDCGWRTILDNAVIQIDSLNHVMIVVPQSDHWPG